MSAVGHYYLNMYHVLTRYIYTVRYATTNDNTTNECYNEQLLSIKSGFSLQHRYNPNSTTPKLQHTSNQEQYDQCGNSTEKSQVPDDGYNNVRIMLSTQEVK